MDWRHDGAIGSLDDRCDLYLPRRRGSAYEGVTVRNVMRMCSGVAWSEEDDGRSGVVSRALVSRRPGAVLDLRCSLPRAQPQGVVLNYSTGDCCLCLARPLRPPRAGRWPTTAPRRSGPAGIEGDGCWHLESAAARPPTS